MWGGTIYNAAGVEVGAYTYADKIVHLASDISSRTAGVVEAIGVVATATEVVMGAMNPIGGTIANCAVGNCSATGLAMAAIPGGGSKLTRWGWTGGKRWRTARRTLQQPGTHQSLDGVVPTVDEAVELIRASGGRVVRIERGHAAGGVSTHTYPHINYTTASGAKATVRVR
jgi:hypothetical protein